MIATQEIHRIAGVPVIPHPDLVSGTPVFENTRVPIATMFEYPEDDYTLDEFIESFSSVKRDAAIQVLHFVEHKLEEQLGSLR